MNKLIIKPIVKPVTVAEVKAMARFDLDDEDWLIDEWIEAATEWLQTYSRRQFLTATFCYTVRCPSKEVMLPSGPFQSIVSVLDGVGNEVDYELDDTGLNAVLEIESTPERSVVTYPAGYGDSPSDLPAGIRNAVRCLAYHYWSCRSSAEKTPVGIINMIDQVLVRRVH